MMFLLIGDIIDYCLQLMRVDRKGPVSILPVKILVVLAFGLYPLGRMGLHFLHHLHERDFLREPEQHVDMVGVAAYFDGLTPDIIADATQIFVQLLLHRRMDEVLPVLGAEHQMDVVLYE